ncbi:MAG: DUF4437 domain-containing protein [Planctomycetota bacterium]
MLKSLGRSGPVWRNGLPRHVRGRFSSSPHIRNVTCRGVVLGGEVHDDDPPAETMCVPKELFWTRSAGEVHGTSIRVSTNLAYIERAARGYASELGISPNPFREGDRHVHRRIGCHRVQHTGHAAE